MPDLQKLGSKGAPANGPSGLCTLHAGPGLALSSDRGHLQEAGPATTRPGICPHSVGLRVVQRTKEQWRLK
jgi:hypothetical protein